jgi:hypothetical protein
MNRTIKPNNTYCFFMSKVLVMKIIEAIKGKRDWPGEK